jgi:hypothetical protein
MIRAFRRHDAEGLDRLSDLWDENPDMATNRAFLAGVKAHTDNLQEVMAVDRVQLHDRTERGRTPPPKESPKDPGE